MEVKIGLRKNVARWFHRQHQAIVIDKSRNLHWNSVDERMVRSWTEFSKMLNQAYQRRGEEQVFIRVRKWDGYPETSQMRDAIRLLEFDRSKPVIAPDDPCIRYRWFPTWFSEKILLQEDLSDPDCIAQSIVWKD